MSTVAETFDTKQLGHGPADGPRMAAGWPADGPRMAAGWPADGRYLSGGVAWQVWVQEALLKTSKNPIRKLSLGNNRVI